jgi:protein-disulfide isomerase
VASALTPDEMKQVEALMKDPKFDDGIAKDVSLGTKAGLSATPTMVITHKLQTYPMTGAISYTILKRFLDDRLASK